MTISQVHYRVRNGNTYFGWTCLAPWFDHLAQWKKMENRSGRRKNETSHRLHIAEMILFSPMFPPVIWHLWEWTHKKKCRRDVRVFICSAGFRSLIFQLLGKTKAKQTTTSLWLHTVHYVRFKKSHWITSSVINTSHKILFKCFANILIALIHHRTWAQIEFQHWNSFHS